MLSIVCLRTDETVEIKKSCSFSSDRKKIPECEGAALFIWVNKDWDIPVVQTIVFPKGVRPSPAILKCCMPKGMPMRVMQQTAPSSR